VKFGLFSFFEELEGSFGFQELFHKDLVTELGAPEFTERVVHLPLGRFTFIVKPTGGVGPGSSFLPQAQFLAGRRDG